MDDLSREEVEEPAAAEIRTWERATPETIFSPPEALAREKAPLSQPMMPVGFQTPEAGQSVEVWLTAGEGAGSLPASGGGGVGGTKRSILPTPDKLFVSPSAPDQDEVVVGQTGAGGWWRDRLCQACGAINDADERICQAAPHSALHHPAWLSIADTLHRAKCDGQAFPWRTDMAE